MQQATGKAARLAGDAMAEVFNESQMNVFHTMEAVPEEAFYISEMESERDAVNVASSAMNSILCAVRAANKMMDVDSGIESIDAVVDSVVEAGSEAHSAVDGANGYEEFRLAAESARNVDGSDGEEEFRTPAHIVGFWKAVERDVVHLEAGMAEGVGSTPAVESLSASPLWADGIPSWASRRWSSFRDELPPAEGWEVWIDWYRDRLLGRASNPEREMARLTIGDNVWEQGPERANAAIASLKTPPGPHGDDEYVDGLDQESGSWGDYPLDDLLIRQENRTIHDIIRRIDQSTYVMDPDFQRDFIWTEDKQSKLIESVIMRIPLPVFYMAEDDDGRMVVVDGLQRLSTFWRFIKDKLRLKLPARHELDGKRFSELPSKIQNRVEDCNLIFYIIDSKVPERARLDIFERVNGGVPLTRQQMRNSLFMGRATQFLKDESRSDIFLEATGGSLNRATMRDREFVNRFCAFHLLGTDEYRGDMDEFLAQCLRHMNGLKQDELDTLSAKFRRGLGNNLLLFKRHAFRKHRPDQTWRSVLNASLWDVMSTELSRYEERRVSACAETVRKAVYGLLADEEFNASITYGTSDV
ncbi:MAG: DUF262 domain-containing protein, partial [Chloroflexota bacterium]|nr:DUF262 domain-containing protein [Chloroflexota bacterium]